MVEEDFVPYSLGQRSRIDAGNAMYRLVYNASNFETSIAFAAIGVAGASRTLAAQRAAIMLDHHPFLVADCQPFFSAPASACSSRLPL